MKYFLGFVFVLFVLAPLGNSEEINEFEVLPSDYTLYIAGSLYNGDNQPIVDSVVSWRHFLYCSLRYPNGDQKLEVWNVQDPTEPQRIQVIEYRNLMDGPLSFKYLPKINVFGNCVWVRVRYNNILFKPNESGELIYEKEITDKDLLGMPNEEASYRMRRAGQYGTFYGIVYGPGIVPPEEEYGYVILTHQDPENPRLLKNRIPRGHDRAFEFPGPIEGVLGNKPVSFSVDEEEKSIELFYRTPASKEFVDVLWVPHLKELFHSETLENTLEEQINKVIKTDSIEIGFSEAIEAYSSNLQLEEDVTLSELIQQIHASDVKLIDLMETYGIHRDDPIERAIKLILHHHFPQDPEIQLGEMMFKPLVEKWLDELFNIPLNDIVEIKNTIAGMLNEGITKETAARLFLERYIKPLLEKDTPEWIFWTLEELVEKVLEVDEVKDVSENIKKVNTTIKKATLMDVFLKTIENLFEYPLDEDFPEDVPEFLNAILYEKGARLNPEGLAFMEMLKFYQYYIKNDEYQKYDEQFAEILTESQRNLAQTVVDQISPFLDAITFQGTVSDRLSTYTEDVPYRTIFVNTMSKVILQQLQKAGVNTEQTVEELMDQYSLYLEMDDIPFTSSEDPAEIQDLTQVIEEEIHQAEKTIQEYWFLCSQETEFFNTACKLILYEIVHEQWGDLPIDSTLHNFIYDFMVHRVDTKTNWAEKLDTVFKDFVLTSMGDCPAFLSGDLRLPERAYRGDLIARWQMAFKIAKTATNISNPNLSFTFQTMEITTREAYRQAVGAIMESLLMEFAQMMREKMFYGFENWVSLTEYHERTIHYDYLTQLDPIRIHPFTQQDRLGFIGLEEWDIVNPRSISLVIFNPFMDYNVVHEYVFENKWGHVDNIHTDQNVVGIFGSEYVGAFDIQPAAALIAMEKNRIQVHKIHYWELPSTAGMVPVANQNYMALYGPYGIHLVPYPTIKTSSEEEDNTIIEQWSLYE